jgi:hypothetical protein
MGADGQKLTSSSEAVSIPGYVPDETKAQDVTLGEGSDLITVVYEYADIPYTVSYFNKYTGEKIADSYTLSKKWSEDEAKRTVTVTAPSHIGYRLADECGQVKSLVLSAKESLNTISFYYVPRKAKTVTISYIFEDGSKAADDSVITVYEGEAARQIKSPVIEGYEPDRAEVEVSYDTLSFDDSFAQKVVYTHTDTPAPSEEPVPSDNPTPSDDPSSDVPAEAGYIVRFTDTDGKEIASPVTGTAHAGDEIIVCAKHIMGYHLQDGKEKAIITLSALLKLSLYGISSQASSSSHVLSTAT